MPILTKEQGTVDVSPSSGQLSPIDTFSRPAENNSAALDAERLSRSLASFANMMEPIEAQDRAIKEKTKDNLFPTWVENVSTDMAGGLSAMAATKKLYPQESPLMQQRLAQAATINKLEKDLYPQWSAIFADQATLTDPKKLQAKIDGIKAEYLKNNPGADEFEKAAILTGIQDWEGKVKARAIDPQADALYKAGQDRFISESNPGLMSSQSTVANASATVGVDPRFTLTIMKSYNPNGNPTARNRYQGQTASGLMDITDGTWHYLVDKYGKQYGVTEEMKNDPRGSALMGAAYAKELFDQITAEKGSPATVGEVNAAYMLGFGGFKKMLSLSNTNPDVKMNQVLDSNTFRVNGNFFRKKDGSVMTVGEAMDKWEGASLSSGALIPTRRFDGASPFTMTKENFSSSQGYKWTDFKNSGVYGGDGQFDGRLINMLDAVTEQFGRGKLKLSSGYRDPDYNRKVSFSKDSQHSQGTALDIDVSGYSAEDKKRLVSLFVAAGARGVGHYSDGSIHIDLRSSPSKNTPDGLALWYGKEDYKSGEKWFSEAIDDGRKMRGEGVVPVAGFNGQGVSGFDMRVNEAGKYGMTRKDARDALFTTMLSQAEAARDVSILEAIPDGSISAEQQAKKMEMMRNIPKLIMQENAIKDNQTEQNMKKAVLERQTEILERTAKGEIIDPDQMATITYKDADGRDKTDRIDNLRDLAVKQNEADRIDGRSSQAYMFSLSSNLESMFASGEPGEMFKNYPRIQALIDANNGKVPTNEELTNAIIYDPNMNKGERDVLLKQLPTMSGLSTVVSDPIFTDSTKPVQNLVNLYMNSDVSKFADIDPKVKTAYENLASDVEDYQRTEFISAYKAWAAKNPGIKVTDDVKYELAKVAKKEALEHFGILRTAIDDLISNRSKKDPTGDSQPLPAYKTGERVVATYEGRPLNGTVDSVAADAVMVKGPDGVIYAVPLNQIQNSSNARVAGPTSEPARTDPSGTTDTVSIEVPNVFDASGNVDMNKVADVADTVRQQLTQAQTVSAEEQKLADEEAARAEYENVSDLKSMKEGQAEYVATMDYLAVNDPQYQKMKQLVSDLYALGKNDEAKKLAEEVDQYVIARTFEPRK